MLLGEKFPDKEVIWSEAGYSSIKVEIAPANINK